MINGKSTFQVVDGPLRLSWCVINFMRQQIRQAGRSPLTTRALCLLLEHYRTLPSFSILETYSQLNNLVRSSWGSYLGVKPKNFNLCENGQNLLLGSLNKGPFSFRSISIGFPIPQNSLFLPSLFYPARPCPRLLGSDLEDFEGDGGDIFIVNGLCHILRDTYIF